MMAVQVGLEPWITASGRPTRTAGRNRDNLEKQVKLACVITLRPGVKTVTELRVVELREEF